MSKRPNIASDHEKAVEEEIQAARRERDQKLIRRASVDRPAAEPVAVTVVPAWSPTPRSIAPVGRVVPRAAARCPAPNPRAAVGCSCVSATCGTRLRRVATERETR